MKHVETVQEIEKKLSMEIEFENQMVHNLKLKYQIIFTFITIIKYFYR